jgi:hypothetical protein
MRRLFVLAVRGFAGAKAQALFWGAIGTTSQFAEKLNLGAL